jgi:nucleotide-binding universal stress UspA family protein
MAESTQTEAGVSAAPSPGAPYHHIACCVEPSPMAERVLAEALRLRALGPGRLTLLHAAPSPSLAGGYYRDRDETLPIEDREWLETVGGPIPDAERVLLAGPAAEEVVRWAAEAGVDLIVAGAHRGRVERAILGSVATYLAYNAPCTVLLVRPPAGD